MLEFLILFIHWVVLLVFLPCLIWIKLLRQVGPVGPHLCVCVCVCIHIGVCVYWNGHLGTIRFFLENGLNNSRMRKTFVENEVSLPSGTSVFCLSFPRGLEGLCAPCLSEQSWWPGLTPRENSFGMGHWGLVPGESDYGRWNFHACLGFLLALSPSNPSQGTGTWPWHLSCAWELSWYSSADQELRSKAALSGHFLTVLRRTIDFFLKKTTKKTLSPIQAVFPLELKALRPRPAPGSFSFCCSRKGC